MPTPISELVYFIGEDTKIMRDAKKAVEWLAQKPAIIEVLEDAKRLHGKPLPIHVSPKHLSAGYGIVTETEQLEHAVRYNSRLFDGVKLKTVEGTHIGFSPERFLAHEFKHASQVDVLKSSAEYVNRRQRIREEIAREFKVSSISPEKFIHRFEMAADDPQQVRRVFEDMYDEQIAPIIPVAERVQATTIERIKKDPEIRAYFQRYEEPAIAFENQIMHGREPARILDYADSQDMGEGMAQLKDRNAWIDANLAVYLDNFRESKALSEARLAEETGAKPPRNWIDKTDRNTTNINPSLPG